MDSQTPNDGARSGRFAWLMIDAVVVIAAALTIARLLAPQKPPPDRLGNFDEWRPTRAEIRQAVGTGRGGSYADARHLRFAEMFKNRFRAHAYAVGARFPQEGTIEIQLAAMIPRWDMARIAISAKEEADQAFGGDHRVAICETYIGTPAMPIGELVATPGGRLRIEFGKQYPRAAPRSPARHGRERTTQR